jgi:hypothetical protein
MTAGQGISVEIKRNGQVTTRLNPAFTFQGGADRPNFSMSPPFSLHYEHDADDRLPDQVFLDLVICLSLFALGSGFDFGYCYLGTLIILDVNGWPFSGKEMKGY